MKFSFEDIRTATNGQVIGASGLGQICTDTRTIQTGDWFLALVGERFDGHRFLLQAQENGAGGCIISEAPPKEWTGGCVRVADTTEALQDLGRYSRSLLQGPVVGLTGTTGKTTTRAMIACALSAEFRVHQTVGNLNNHLGVPMTLAATPVDAEAIVVEMGTSSPGEIGFLADLARPNVRIVLNVGAGHLEELGGLEGVAWEKGALIRSAVPGDLICVNLDDERVSGMVVPEGTRCVTWGSHSDADIRVHGVAVDGETLHTRAIYETPKGALRVCFNGPGEHLAHNGACALAVAYGLGLSLDKAASALCAYQPVGMRQRIEWIGKRVRVINDAYNANPVSMNTALETLAGLNGRRIAVLGDMLELGSDAVAYHRDVLIHATKLGLDQVVLMGRLFREANEDCQRVRWFSDTQNAVSFLRSYLRSGDQVLFKGSRGSRVERILQSLQESESV